MAAQVQVDLKYRLDVFAPNVDAVLAGAGGWLFDRARAGWKVGVLVLDRCDPLPLVMMGLTPLNLDWTLGSMQRRPRPRVLATVVDLYETDPWIRVAVRDALASSVTDVTLWGDEPPAELQRRLHIEHYRPSAAARAFKAHAMVGAVGAEMELLRMGGGTCGISRPPAPARGAAGNDTAAS